MEVIGTETVHAADGAAASGLAMTPLRGASETVAVAVRLLTGSLKTTENVSEDDCFKTDGGVTESTTGGAR